MALSLLSSISSKTSFPVEEIKSSRKSVGPAPAETTISMPDAAPSTVTALATEALAKTRITIPDAVSSAVTARVDTPLAKTTISMPDAAPNTAVPASSTPANIRMTKDTATTIFTQIAYSSPSDEKPVLNKTDANALMLLLEKSMPEEELGEIMLKVLCGQLGYDYSWVTASEKQTKQ